MLDLCRVLQQSLTILAEMASLKVQRYQPAKTSIYGTYSPSCMLTEYTAYFAFEDTVWGAAYDSDFTNVCC